MKLKSLLLVLSVLSLISCKLVDEPLAKMDAMKEGMDKVQDGTGRLTGMQRTGVGSQIRNFEKKSMEDSDELEQKVTHAGVYMNAYEFQIWTNDTTVGDDDQRRLELMHQATEQYFRLVREYWKGMRKKNFIGPSSKKNDALNLFALSLTLHKQHYLQKDFLEGTSHKPVTMLSMIKDTFRKSAAIDKGTLEKSDLHEYEVEIRNYLPEARLLLEMRHNMLAAMVLSEISEVTKDYSAIFLGIPELFVKARHLVFKWSSDYTDENSTIQETMNTWLEESLSTRDFLRSVGLKVKLDGKLKRIFKKMKVASCSDCDFEIDQSVNRFLDNVDTLLNQ